MVKCFDVEPLACRQRADLLSIFVSSVLVVQQCLLDARRSGSAVVTSRAQLWVHMFLCCVIDMQCCELLGFQEQRSDGAVLREQLEVVGSLERLERRRAG